MISRISSKLSRIPESILEFRVSNMLVGTHSISRLNVSISILICVEELQLIQLGFTVYASRDVFETILEDFPEFPNQKMLKIHTKRFVEGCFHLWSTVRCLETISNMLWHTRIVKFDFWHKLTVWKHISPKS